jgi:hypothetical protein
MTARNPRPLLRCFFPATALALVVALGVAVGTGAGGFARADSQSTLTLGRDDILAELLELAVAGSAAEGGRQAEGVTLVLDGLEGSALTFEDANVFLGPEDAEGRRLLRMDAQLFADGSTFSFEGSVALAAGPGGGHALEGTYALLVRDIRSLAASFPGRVPESLSGEFVVRGDTAGFLGDKGNENAPAEPLRSTFEARSEFQVLGWRRPLVARGKWRTDDIRVSFSSTHLVWEDLEADVTGWAALARDGAWNARVSVASEDPAALGERFGLDARFLPRGPLAGKVEFFGSPSDWRISYELIGDRLEAPMVEGRGLVAEDVKLSGRIFDPYLPFNVSVNAGHLRVGGFDAGRQVFGMRYEPGKFTTAAIDLPFLDSKAIFTSTWESGAGIYATQLSFDGASVAALAEHFLGGKSPVDKGFATAIAVESNRGGKPWRAARVRLLYGELKAENLGRRVLDALAPEGETLIDEEVVKASSGLLESERTPFHKISFEVTDGDDGGARFGALEARLGRTELTGAGTIGADGAVSLDGWYSFAPRLVDALENKTGWLASLRASDGWLHVPVTIDGPWTAPGIHIRADALALFARAAAGEEVAGYGVLPAPSLDVDVPELPILE